MPSTLVGNSNDPPQKYCILDVMKRLINTVNNYRQVTGMVTGENFAFFIYRHFVETL